MAKLEQQRPDMALALMAAALDADSAAEDARALADRILRETVWNFPLLTLRHSLPVEHVFFAEPSSLWVSLAGESNTTVRWNLESMRVESVLFPLPKAETRSLVPDPSRRWIVVERAGVPLLCNAQTLKPIGDLGLLPDFVTPSSVIAFSADGLLLAHPAFVSQQDRSLVWHLRDAATGGILRSSEPAAADAPRPLAAFLDRRELRVLHADGSLLEIPVSPVEVPRITPAAKPVALLHAQFGAGGRAALALIDHGPHQAPALRALPFGAVADATLEPAALLERFPWSRHPGIWTGLLRGAENQPLVVDGRILFPRDGPHAPIHAASDITAAAASGPLRIVGEENGRLLIHRLLPKPLAVETAEPPRADGQSIAAFRNLTEALAGIRQDEKTRVFIRIDAAERLRIFRECDFDALRRMFPGLDFSPLVTDVMSISPRAAGPDATKILTERLARAAPAADGDSSAAAKLALALESDWPAWIEECLASAVDLPPLLRKIAVSRIAWLQGRKADALAGWPELFPDLGQVRLREDWDGWEQADFGPALEQLRRCMMEELAALELPQNATSEQRRAVIGRLMDPATPRSIGRQRFARACLEAARALSSSADDAEATLKLASMARDLGAAAEPCLRAEARAFSALGDYQKAHDRWIQLITGHPVAAHESADYAEAAYTAFETANPRQAMEILTTGLHRFPEDADFALRAGWIALLTGNPDRACRFLLAGRGIGFPPEKLENATALLAVAAAQSGSADDAAAFYQDLLALDSAWREPANIEALDWPDELKATLRQLSW